MYPIIYLAVLTLLYSFVIGASFIRIVKACWYHPEVKVSRCIFFFQGFLMISCYSWSMVTLHMRKKYQNYIRSGHFREYATEKGDFYNTWSACELQLAWIILFNSICMVKIATKYSELVDNTLQEKPSLLVSRQIYKVLDTSETLDDMNRRVR